MSETKKVEGNLYDQDWLLEELVDLANVIEGAEFPVTLMVGGTLVSGVAIGLKEYFVAYGVVWRELLGNTEVAAKEQDRWAKYGDSAIAEYKEQREKAIAKGEPFRPHFIHLKDTKALSGQILIPTEGGMLWRARLSEVQGFLIGTLGIGGAQQSK